MTDGKFSRYGIKNYGIDTSNLFAKIPKLHNEYLCKRDHNGRQKCHHLRLNVTRYYLLKCLIENKDLVDLQFL